MEIRPDAGWYPDPSPGANGGLRYWDGSTWTGQTQDSRQFLKAPTPAAYMVAIGLGIVALLLVAAIVVNLSIGSKFDKFAETVALDLDFEEAWVKDCVELNVPQAGAYVVGEKRYECTLEATSDLNSELRAGVTGVIFRELPNGTVTYEAPEL